MTELQIAPTGFHGKGHGTEFDNTDFKNKTEWLMKSFINDYDGTLPLHEAYKKAYHMSISDFESEIEEAIRDAEAAGDPAGSAQNSPVVQNSLTGKQYEMLVDWYIRECPDHRTFAVESAKKILMSTKDIINGRLSTIIKMLRENYFCTLPGANDWKKLIEEASMHPKDMVTVSSNGRGGTVRTEKREVPFDDHVSESRESKERLGSYLAVQAWLLKFDEWRNARTQAQMERYQQRINTSTVWGRLTQLQHHLRIRRTLDSWKIQPPPNMEVFEEKVTMETVWKSIVGSTHLLASEKEMFLWYWEVNYRALQLKLQKLTTPGRRKVTPNEAFENIPRQIEMVTFYTPWINYGGRSYTTLEAVEIAFEKRSHRIDPCCTTEEYRQVFVQKITDCENIDNKLEHFPSSAVPIEWTEPIQAQVLKELKWNERQYAAAYGIMFRIYQNQAIIQQKMLWYLENERRNLAGEHSIPFDEWKDCPFSGIEVPKESWITGKVLPPGTWRMVAIEGSRHPLYRTINRLRDRFRDTWKHGKTPLLQAAGTTPTPTSTISGSEEETAVIADIPNSPIPLYTEQQVSKCALCSEKASLEAMDVLYIHREHHSAFYSYTNRFRRNKTAQEGQHVQPERKPEDIEKKYKRLKRTIDSWAEMSDAEQVYKRIRSFVKRNKSNGACVLDNNLSDNDKNVAGE